MAANEIEYKGKSGEELVEYCKELEERLESYDSDTEIAKMYVGVLNQVRQISDLFNEIELDQKTLHSKEDKFMERYKFFIEKFENIAKGLKNVEKMIDPQKAKEAKDKKKDKRGSPWEETVKGEQKKKKAEAQEPDMDFLNDETQDTPTDEGDPF